jgi:CrcB protein
VKEMMAVFVGGGLGALLRWQFQSFLNKPEHWPWGTFTVNLIGGLAAGCCLALAERLSPETRLFVVTGVLGGLTTFSALSYEMVAMMNRGEHLWSLCYGLISLTLATAFCWLGFMATHRLGSL